MKTVFERKLKYLLQRELNGLVEVLDFCDAEADCIGFLLKMLDGKVWPATANDVKNGKAKKVDEIITYDGQGGDDWRNFKLNDWTYTIKRVYELVCNDEKIFGTSDFTLFRPEENSSLGYKKKRLQCLTEQLKIDAQIEELKQKKQLLEFEVLEIERHLATWYND